MGNWLVWFIVAGVLMVAGAFIADNFQNFVKIAYLGGH